MERMISLMIAICFLYLAAPQNVGAVGGKVIVPKIIVHYDYPLAGEFLYSLVTLTNISSSTVDVNLTLKNPAGTVLYDDEANWIKETQLQVSYTEYTSGGVTATVTIEPSKQAYVLFHGKHGQHGSLWIEWTPAAGEADPFVALVGLVDHKTFQGGQISWDSYEVNGGRPF